MTIEPKDALLRVLCSRSVNNDTLRAMYTALLFFEADEYLTYCLPPHHNTDLIDPKIVDAAIACASPIEAATILWDPLGQSLPPQRFHYWFDWVWSSTRDFRALHYLAGAARDFLRTHPEALSIPQELPQLLLATSSPDARIVASKLVQQISANALEIREAVASMLVAQGADERGGALYVLLEVLDCHRSGRRLYQNIDGFKELQPIIARLFKEDADADVRNMARQFLEQFAAHGVEGAG